MFSDLWLLPITFVERKLHKLQANQFKIMKNNGKKVLRDGCYVCQIEERHLTIQYMTLEAASKDIQGRCMYNCICIILQKLVLH